MGSEKDVALENSRICQLKLLVFSFKYESTLHFLLPYPYLVCLFTRCLVTYSVFYTVLCVLHTLDNTKKPATPRVMRNEIVKCKSSAGKTSITQKEMKGIVSSKARICQKVLYKTIQIITFNLDLWITVSKALILGWFFRLWHKEKIFSLLNVQKWCRITITNSVYCRSSSQSDFIFARLFDLASTFLFWFGVGTSVTELEIRDLCDG